MTSPKETETWEPVQPWPLDCPFDFQVYKGSPRIALVDDELGYNFKSISASVKNKPMFVPLAKRLTRAEAVAAAWEWRYGTSKDIAALDYDEWRAVVDGKTNKVHALASVPEGCSRIGPGPFTIKEILSTETIVEDSAGRLHRVPNLDIASCWQRRPPASDSRQESLL